MSDEIGREREDAKILKLDAHENMEITSQHGVLTLPPFFLYSGGEVKAQFAGTKSKNDLIRWIDENKQFK